MSVRQCQVAVVGGGLVGASLALATARLGLDTVLVEAVPFRAAAQPSYDDRTLALNHASCRILEGLGLWPGLADAATAIRQVIVRNPGRPGRVVLNPAEIGVDRFGHVVEARAFGQAALAALDSAKSVQLLCPVKVTGVALRDDAARVELEGSDECASVEAHLLVAADGANSFVRRAVGIEAREHDYGQSAVICNLTPSEPHRGRAWELLTTDGPFAVLPHVGNRCGLVWTAPTGAAEALEQLPEDQFIERAQARFGSELGTFERIGRRSRYPLREVRALADTAPRTVVLGNAAHTLHPIGAQGFNLGLRDVATLAEVLADRGATDPGHAELLARYSAWRQPDQAGTMAYADGLARGWSNPTALMGLARDAGFMAHALLPPLRRQLALRAMGYRGRVPRLAMGEPLA